MALNTEQLCACKHCGLETRIPGMVECDGCYELRTRIEGNRELARRMLAAADAYLQSSTKTGRFSSQHLNVSAGPRSIEPTYDPALSF